MPTEITATMTSILLVEKYINHENGRDGKSGSTKL